MAIDGIKNPAGRPAPTPRTRTASQAPLRSQARERATNEARLALPERPRTVPRGDAAQSCASQVHADWERGALRLREPQSSHDMARITLDTARRLLALRRSLLS